MIGSSSLMSLYLKKLPKLTFAFFDNVPASSPFVAIIPGKVLISYKIAPTPSPASERFRIGKPISLCVKLSLLFAPFELLTLAFMAATLILLVGTTTTYSLSFGIFLPKIQRLYDLNEASSILNSPTKLSTLRPAAFGYSTNAV